jgi:hypothetical protein
MPINWQEIITAIVTAVGGGAVFLAAAAWLIKALVSNRLALDAEKFKIAIRTNADREIEAFRIGLQANANTEIERLKNALQILADERKVLFSKLHEKRASVIAELHERFVTAYWAAHTYHQWVEFQGGPTEEEQAATAWQTLREAYNFFEKNRIISLRLSSCWARHVF